MIDVGYGECANLADWQTTVDTKAASGLANSFDYSDTSEALECDWDALDTLFNHSQLQMDALPPSSASPREDVVLPETFTDALSCPWLQGICKGEMFTASVGPQEVYQAPPPPEHMGYGWATAGMSTPEGFFASPQSSLSAREETASLHTSPSWTLEIFSAELLMPSLPPLATLPSGGGSMLDSSSQGCPILQTAAGASPADISVCGSTTSGSFGYRTYRCPPTPTSLLSSFSKETDVVESSPEPSGGWPPRPPVLSGQTGGVPAGEQVRQKKTPRTRTKEVKETR